jgi:sugar phosphate permease
VSVEAVAGHVEVRTPRRAWLVWGLAVVAYAVAVFHRGSLGVSGVAAQHRFGATAAQLSLFGVLQLAVYASLQVPVGALLDRLGSRRLIATGGVVMAVGQLVMANSHSIAFAVLARVLVGAGDAMTFTSVLRLVALWFVPRRVPLMSQLTGILGQLGQIAATYPLVALLRSAGWSRAFTGAGVVGLVVAVVVALTLRDVPAGTAVVVPPAGWTQMRTQLVDAWREPGTQLGLWTHFVTQFSGTVFVLLWGYPFLVVGEGRSPAEAGGLLTLCVIVSMVVGPLLGQYVGRWPFRRSAPVLAIVMSSALVWAVVLVWPGRAPLALLVVLVIVLGANGPGSMVGFDFARTENPPQRIGSATGIVNVGGFVASLLTILLIGLVLDVSSGGSAYGLGDFRVAMTVQYLFWAIGLVAFLRARRRLKAVRGIVLDPFHRAVVRVTRDRRGR